MSVGLSVTVSSCAMTLTASGMNLLVLSVLISAASLSFWSSVILASFRTNVAFRFTLESPRRLESVSWCWLPRTRRDMFLAHTLRC